MVKMIRCVYVLLLAMMLYTGTKAEVNYQMSLDNGQQVDANTFEFDVYIKSMDSTFQLTSYQCSFSFYVNDSSLSFSYVSGTSELSNPPSIGIGLKTSDGTQKLTFASMPGSDYISSAPLRVGSFRLQDANSLDGMNPNIRWNFEGKVTTILTGTNFVDITNPSNHIKSFGNLVKYEVIGVTASAVEDSNYTPYTPEKTIDGLGYYDGDEYSRWKVKPMPQYLIFDLGREKSVSITKFSFYNFQAGRIYQYTTSVSDDQVNWTDVVVNASSASEEWTVDQFDAVQARYVKLQFLSSTNNPESWANLWEAQILGEEQSLPVELSSYAGSVDNNNIVINWVTSSEINNNGFEIERQTNDGEFEVIGFVQGHGTTNETCNYSFTDKDLTAAKYSYRLKQISFDKSYCYSDTLYFEISSTVDVNDLNNGVNTYQLYQNYPNPFNPQTTIRFDIKEENFVNLSIYNILGEKVKELVNNVLARGSHEIKFDGSQLSSGIYLCRLDVKDEYTNIKKMSLLK